MIATLAAILLVPFVALVYVLIWLFPGVYSRIDGGEG